MSLFISDKMKLEWILIAKGVGTFLVVAGHFWPVDSPSYWTEVRRIIYTFHMPLFFFLSGWLYQYGKYSYRELLSAKIQRLLFPFASIAVLFLVIKIGAGVFFELENPVDYRNLYAILVNPVKSYVPSLWYVHSLFIIFAIYPLFRCFISDFWLFLIFIVLNICLDSDADFYGKMLHNCPFFIAGIILRNNETMLLRWLNGSMFTVSFLALLFTSSCYSLKNYLTQDTPGEYPMVFMAGICGTLLTIMVSRKLAISDARVIRTLATTTGIYSMSIYLFHTLFESATRIVLMQTLGGLNLPFEFVFVTAVAAGLIFPLALEKYFLQKNYMTRRFMLGIR
jgi:fucose 4-O-acetylase-like acetyltransferase